LPPGFVYGIYVSLFLAFDCFAVNQWLLYRARGRWADYLHGEHVHVWLSLTAKSLLAWQVFANVLVGTCGPTQPAIHTAAFDLIDRRPAHGSREAYHRRTRGMPGR
jgi:hypothetical protein